MKNKRFLFFLLILTIVVLCIVTYFITRPQPEELYPQVFAKMPEKPELIQQFQHSLLITSVAISPTDPNLIAGVNNEGYIRIWNRKNIEDSRFLYHSGKFPSHPFLTHWKIACKC